MRRRQRRDLRQDCGRLRAYASGKNGFFQKGDRDREGAVHQTDKNIEDAGHWLGDRLGIHF